MRRNLGMKDYNYSKEETISQYFFEGEMARAERHVKRWVIVWIITFAALIFSNIGWLYFESQFTETEVSQEVDTGEGAATVIGVGDYYGEGETNSQNENTQSRR